MTQPLEVTIEDAELDRQVIDALIHPEGELMRALYRGGWTVEAIKARAARLGLTSEVLKRCRVTGTRPSLRKCINCDAQFLSEGPQNRLCRRCPTR